MKTWDGRGKGILRLALDGVVPPEVLHRRKSPYPKTHHPGYLEVARAKLQQVLDDLASPLSALIDTAYVRELVRTDGSSFGTTWFGQLMAGPQLFAYLCQVDAWLRGYRVTIGGGQFP